VDEYGDNLICVRYRYDKQKNLKLKTIEVIVEEQHWEMDTKRIPHNKCLAIKVYYNETHLKNVVKSAGGKWNQTKRAWILPYAEIVNLGLEGRIIKNE